MLIFFLRSVRKSSKTQFPVGGKKIRAFETFPDGPEKSMYSHSASVANLDVSNSQCPERQRTKTVSGEYYC